MITYSELFMFCTVIISTVELTLLCVTLFDKKNNR